MEVFGSSGVRGVVGEDLTPTFVLRVATAAGTVWGAERAAVARDTRHTGGMLADAAAAGLARVGSDVDRLGVVPTPATQLYAERGGIPVVVITASHNPPEYNGVKLVGSDGIELSIGALERIEGRLAGAAAGARWDAVGERRTVEGVGRRYIEAICGAVERERIADAALTVALDPGHGAGALTSPELLRELGCRVLTVNAQPDGHFPGRDPEPVPEHLGDLRRLVRASEADLGVAHDGDADRAIFVDERGEYIEGDATFAALAAAELGRGDTVVSAVTASQRLVDLAERVGATLERTPVGSTRIISRVRELDAAGESVPIAGEGNGGVLFPAYRLARDGAYAAARFLELVAERPASEVVGGFAGYHNVRTTVGYEDDAERAAILAAAERHAASSSGELDATDGYRLDFGGAWVLARASGTEPLVRVYAEAREKARAGGLAEEMRAALEAGRDEE
jgi:phosphomannomutase/phosphoglucomutase